MRTLVLLMILLGIAAGAWAGSVGDAVELRIITDNGSELPFYPVSGQSPNRRVYAEAVKGDQYRIVVRNRLNRRVGIVVAVDGRNIITGKKSWLKNDERMYILEPFAEGEFKGWRTGDDRINRFYFTPAADSYAAAFNDTSAMGVIAVAVYPELHYDPPVEMDRGASMNPFPAPSMQKRVQAFDKIGESAGTGYGREEYSPVRTVAFEPERAAVEKIYVKYEWRETLCRKGIVACRKRLPRPRNRMWDDDGYAAPPPGRS
ncbi:MAG: hypothetical protein M0T70_00365 [Geobacteraceae bacterium]|nr:hypothetical protein [Geobacteraceae bacterium]